MLSFGTSLSVKEPLRLRSFPFGTGHQCTRERNNSECYNARGGRKRHRLPSMEWKPAGLLRDAVKMKMIEVETVEKILKERPDHPVNLRRSFFAQQSTHSFSKALRKKDGSLAIVGAVKRFQAPRPGQSAEVISPLEDIASDVRSLWTSGTDALLFYTDEVRHGIELNDMRKAARALTSVQESSTDARFPMARHDLIVDPVQIAEAAVVGGSAVNLVAAAILPDLLELLNAATAMGLEAIVECHSPLEVDFAMECGATILFLNNWDRTRNVLEPSKAVELIESVPPFILTLAGGGLTTASDCWDMLDAGFNGVVLGKALLQSRRRSSFIEEIRSQKRFTGNMFTGNMGVPFSEDS